MLNSKKDHLSCAYVADASEFRLGARLPRKEEIAKYLAEHIVPDARAAFERTKEIEPANDVLEHQAKEEAKARVEWAEFLEYSRQDIPSELVDPGHPAGDKTTYCGTSTYRTAIGVNTRAEFSAVALPSHRELMAEMLNSTFNPPHLVGGYSHQEARAYPWCKPYGGIEFDKTALEKERRDLFYQLLEYSRDACRELTELIAKKEDSKLPNRWSVESKQRFIREAKAYMALPAGFTHWFGDEEHSEYPYLDAGLGEVEVMFFRGDLKRRPAEKFYWGREDFEDETDICGYRFV